MTKEQAIKAYQRAQAMGANHEEALEYLLIEMDKNSIDKRIELLDDLMARVKGARLTA